MRILDGEDRHVYQAIQQRTITPYGRWTWEESPSTPHRHAGIDLRGTDGEPVYAIGTGEVFQVLHTVFRKTVIVKHPLPGASPEKGQQYLYSVYANMTDVRVRTGDPVTQHTILGRLPLRRIKKDGAHSHNHLHLEIRTSVKDGLLSSLKSQSFAELDAYCYNPLQFYQRYLF